jgi:hypothetical protein
MILRSSLGTRGSVHVDAQVLQLGVLPEGCLMYSHVGRASPVIQQGQLRTSGQQAPPPLPPVRLPELCVHPHTVTESRPCADVWQVGMLACLTRGWWTCPCGPHGTLLPIPILPVLVRLPFPFAICPAPPCPALLACMQGTPSGALGVASPCCCSSWQGPRSMCGALGPQAASAWTDQARLPT